MVPALAPTAVSALVAVLALVPAPAPAVSEEEEEEGEGRRTLHFHPPRTVEVGTTARNRLRECLTTALKWLTVPAKARPTLPSLGRSVPWWHR